MAFCTNCGAQLIQNTKFCPSCGANIISTNKTENSLDEHSNTDDSTRKKVPKPIRGRKNNILKEKAQNFVKEKTQDFIKEKAQDFVEKSTSNSNVPPKSSATNQNIAKNETGDVMKKVRKWMLYYILVNIPLYFINTGDDEILGVLIFSVAVIVGFVIFSLQKKKEKPYTIVLKIVLLLQGLLAVSGIMQRLEFLDNGISLVAVISLALLVFLNIKIILRRNK